jgi:hypothetical protein
MTIVETATRMILKYVGDGLKPHASIGPSYVGAFQNIYALISQDVVSFLGVQDTYEEGHAETKMR